MGWSTGLIPKSMIHYRYLVLLFFLYLEAFCFFIILELFYRYSSIIPNYTKKDYNRIIRNQKNDGIA